MKLSLTSSSLKKQQKGFSLVEILVVLGLIALLSALSLPALVGLGGAGKFNNVVYSVAGLLDQARQHAVASNTYTWVAFYEDTDDNTLYAAVIASKTGVDPSEGSGSIDLSNDDEFTLLNKIEAYQAVGLTSNGDGSGFRASSAPFTEDTLPDINTAVGLGDSTSPMTEFKIKRPGTTRTVNFDRAIRYTPSGEAQESAAFVSNIEFALQPKKGKVLDPNNVAVIRIGGLVGNARIYRP